jgi:hypothetical protein
MTDKPPTTDPEQRAHDTRVSRYQSGLPPEPEEPAQGQPDRPRKDGGAEGSTPGSDEEQQRDG